MLVLRGTIRRHKGGVESTRLYPVAFKNTKRALGWLMRKLHREHPGCHEYAAEIVAEYKNF